ncbi:RmlC-like cupin domain-containing protein [Phyllosticta citriasiana]|uniref:RmlC-like cupin domain-containing protein n=1 Tax=Phyllosticta citriasiana TaxID=595635 RepID=UPI0030FDB907
MSAVYVPQQQQQQQQQQKKKKKKKNETQTNNAPPSPPETASDHDHDHDDKAHEDEDEYNALITSLPRTATAPLWEQMAALNPRTPRPQSVPHIWRYSAIRPQMLRAGAIVPEEKAERRVLMLLNPAMWPPYTTDTLYAGLQLVNPGEVAPAHRHVAVATRFVRGPQTAFTAIQGRRIAMAVHDLIVTPRWTWHDHGNRGASPVIWLDGLDLPSFQHAPVHFVEHFAQSRYPATEARRDECGWVVPWARMKGWLDEAAKGKGKGEGGAYVEKRYGKPDGSEITATLGALAARIAAGASSPMKRETSSAVWHVVAGKGRTEVDGETMRWERGDTIAVPAWMEWRHVADEVQEEGDGAAYLFRFDDLPMLKAFGWYRVEGEDLEALADE